MENLKSRRIALNSFINLMGQIFPMAIGFFTIPIIIKSLGQERFSLLTLAWMAVGYFTFFDLGLGRAVVKLIADKIGENKRSEIPQLVSSSLFLMFILSAVGTIVGFILGPALIEKYLHLSPELVDEAKHSILLLSICIPIITLTAGIRGILEADHLFTEINIFQVLLGAFTYLSPLLISNYSLTNLVGLLIIARIINLLLHIIVVFLKYPELRKLQLPQKKHFPLLLNFGSWITVSNIIGPIMVYFDRFFLSALIPIGNVAYYTAPYEIISRLLIIPSSLSRVLFPAFSTSKILDKKIFHSLYKKSLLSTALILAIPCILVMLLGRWGLNWWLGPEYAEQSTLILQILTIGVFANGMTWIPFTLIQSSGNADWTAKTHLVELPFYLVGLYFLIKNHGITGAAIAWTIRVLVDTFIMFLLARKIVSESPK